MNKYTELHKGKLRELSCTPIVTNSQNKPINNIHPNVILQIQACHNFESLQYENARPMLQVSDGAYSHKIILLKDAVETCRKIEIKKNDILSATIFIHQKNQMIILKFEIIRDNVNYEIGKPEPLEKYKDQE